MYTTRASASDRDNSNFLFCVKAWMSVEMTCDAAEELSFAEGWDIHCSIGLGGDGRVLVRTVFLDCLQYILLLLLPSYPRRLGGSLYRYYEPWCFIVAGYD